MQEDQPVAAASDKGGDRKKGHSTFLLMDSMWGWREGNKR